MISWIEGTAAHPNPRDLFQALRKHYVRDVSIDMQAAVKLVQLQQTGSLHKLRADIATCLALMKEAGDQPVKLRETNLLKAMILEKLKPEVKRHVMSNAKWHSKTLEALFNMAANFEAAHAEAVADSVLGWGDTAAQKVSVNSVSSGTHQQSGGKAGRFGKGLPPPRVHRGSQPPVHMRGQKGCWVCGELDHLMRNCPVNQRAQKVQVSLVDYIKVGLTLNKMDSVDDQDVANVFKVTAGPDNCAVCGFLHVDEECKWVSAVENSGGTLVNVVQEAHDAMVGYLAIKHLE